MGMLRNFKNSVPRNYMILAVVAVVITIIARNFLSAEFFDIFGLVVFLFLTGLGFWMLSTKKEAPNNIAFIVFVIGLLGLFVDGFTVIKTFIIGG